MKNRPWKLPVANCGLLCSFKHSVVRASSSRALSSSMHRVCVTTRLRTTRGCMSSRTSHRGLADRVRKVGSALVRVRGRDPFCCYSMETDSNQDTQLFLPSLGSRPICPDGSTKVDKWAMGLGQLPMLEFTATFFFFFGGGGLQVWERRVRSDSSEVKVREMSFCTFSNFCSKVQKSMKMYEKVKEK